MSISLQTEVTSNSTMFKIFIVLSKINLQTFPMYHVVCERLHKFYITAISDRWEIPRISNETPRTSFFAVQNTWGAISIKGRLNLNEMYVSV